MMKLIGAGQKPGITLTEKDTFWTVPNVITLVRLLLLPLFIVFVLIYHNYIGATIVLVVLALTDWIDGYLARRLNQVSSIGKKLDPLADRISVIVVGLTLAWAGLIPWYIVIIIAAVDLVLLFFSLLWFKGDVYIEVTIAGKIRTALLFLAMPFILLGNGFASSLPNFAGILLVLGYLCLGVGTILHVGVGIDYFIKMYKLKLVRTNEFPHDSAKSNVN